MSCGYAVLGRGRGGAWYSSCLLVLHASVCLFVCVFGVCLGWVMFFFLSVSFYVLFPFLLPFLTLFFVPFLYYSNGGNSREKINKKKTEKNSE